MKKHVGWRRVALTLTLTVLMTGVVSLGQFNDTQSFDGPLNSMFAVPDGTVPYWSVADGCSPAMIFQDGTRGDNGTPCLRSLLPVGVGTRMIADLNPGSGGSTIGGMKVSGYDVIWRLWVAADGAPGVSGSEIYRVQNPLYPVMTLEADLNPGAAGSGPGELYHHNPGSTTRLYFAADNGANGREPWLSNTSTGLTTTMTMIADLNPAGGSDPTGFMGAGSNSAGVGTHLVVFAANDGTNGRELWKTDSTAGNTQMLIDINQSAPGASSAPQQLTQVVFSAAAATLDIRVFFTADDGVNGRELWRTNGTLTGTGLCKDIRGGATGSSPANLTAASLLVSGVASPTLVFTADSDGVNGQELWKSRGALDGTDTLQVYDPGAAGSPANLTAVNGLNVVFFTLGNDLWKSDGTTGGTVLVKTFAAPPANLVSAGSGTAAALYFAADDGTGSGVELWKATATGASQVADIRPGAAGSEPQNLAASGGTVFFSADDGTAGRELWRTDTTAGVLLVKDINPGAASSNPANLSLYEGTMMFSADDGVHGAELWQTDGFAAPNHAGMSYRWDLASLIQAKTGDPAKIAVGGSDETPISVYWMHDFPAMGGPNAGISEAAHQINLYIELTDGTDRAPLDMTFVDCGDGSLPRPKAALTDGNDHKALAFGMVAVLDQDPCDTDSRGGGSPRVPFARVPAVYDGHDWIPMSLTAFPAGVPTAPPTDRVLGQAPSNAYLHTGMPANLAAATDDPWQIRRFGWARIDVWSEHMTVLWGARQSGQTWVATLPRKYKGGFKALYAGNKACQQPAYPFYFDTVHITGGVFVDSPDPFGACCAPAGCVDVASAAECPVGTFSPWAACDDPGYLCCPIPWPDADRDGDVDSIDFAGIQRCLTGNVSTTTDCICFDHNNDNKIDVIDLEAFIDCGTGPGVTGSVPPGCGP